MTTISIQTQKHYKVHIGAGLLDQCGALAAGLLRPCRIVLVSDDTVDALYGDRAASSLEAAGFSVLRFVFPHGEHSKNIRVFSDLLEFLGENAITRSDVIAALGGGVTGDLAGFASAVYLRGVRYLQLPTTFLAAVDSSVGGKTAIDLAAGKNLAGAFWQPEAVFCDTDTFATLPPEVFADGVSEGIKAGIIADAALFDRFVSGEYRSQLEQTVAWCVAIKGGIVAGDETDRGERQLLNFGHTFGHAIERCSGFSVPHGHAVAIGMVIASRAGERRGITAPGVTAQIRAALTECGLPTSCPFSAEELLDAAKADKKRDGDRMTLILPQQIGHAIRYPVAMEELSAFLLDGLQEEL